MKTFISNVRTLSILLLIVIAFVFLPLITTAMLQARVISVPAGGDLRAAITSAQPGDVIELQAGAVFTGPFNLPPKSGSAPITIRSSRASELPDGIRVKPSDAPKMARIISAGRGESALAVAPSAHNWTLVGLEITRTAPDAVVYDLVKLGETGGTQTSLTQVPQNLVIDRCYIHGDSGDLKRGIALNSGRTDILNSYISDFHVKGQEAQAVAGWNGSGPFRIINNYLEGAGENFLYGGSPPSIAGLLPGGLEFRRNHVIKPASWNYWDQANFKPIFGEMIRWTTDPMPGPNEPSNERYAPRYIGPTGNKALHWTVKNILELKTMKGAIIDGNIFDGNWLDAQQGYSILFTVRPNDSGSAAVIEDIQFTNNIVRNVAAGLHLLGQDDLYAAGPKERRLRRVLVANNLWENIDHRAWGGDGCFAKIVSGTEDVTIINNSVRHTGNIIKSGGDPHNGFIFTDNVSRHNDYGVHGDGVGFGNPALAKYYPGAVFQKNAIAKEVFSTSPPNIEAVYPAGNFFPAKLSDVLDANNRVIAYLGQGTGGKNIGADIDAIMAAQGGASPSPSPTVTPTPSPTPSPVPGPTVTPTPIPSPTPTPTPIPSPSPTPSVSYPPREFLWEPANSDSKRREIMERRAKEGWECHPNPAGNWVYCYRMKIPDSTEP